jgi:hypothetical protein
MQHAGLFRAAFHCQALLLESGKVGGPSRYSELIERRFQRAGATGKQNSAERS